MIMTAQPRTGTPRPKLIPWLHEPVSGPPYFDDALEVAQGNVHRVMTGEPVAIFASIAEEAGLLCLSDEPSWYLHPETDTQPTFCGDNLFARALTWCHLREKKCEELAVTPGASVMSEMVPGLELRVRPRDEWRPGYKLDIHYQGERRNRLVEEPARVIAERARADAERERAEAAEAKAARLGERLRELGLDPEG